MLRLHNIKHILLTPYCIDFVIFCLLGDDKVSANTELQESADVETVFEVYLEDDEVAASG